MPYPLLLVAFALREPTLPRGNPWRFKGRVRGQRVERDLYFLPDGRVFLDDYGVWDCSDDCVRWTIRGVHYHANLYKNDWGDRPRMFCGIVTRDRGGRFRRLFRPVLGTFVSYGDLR